MREEARENIHERGVESGHGVSCLATTQYIPANLKKRFRLVSPGIYRGSTRRYLRRQRKRGLRSFSLPLMYFFGGWAKITKLGKPNFHLFIYQIFGTFG